MDDSCNLTASAVQLYDLRSTQADPHRKSKRRGGRTVKRDPAQVDSVVLHQAGVAFGRRGDQPLHTRALGVTCHAMAFRDGSAVLAAPARWYLYAAGGLNRRSVSLEVDGLYPGVRGGAVSKGVATPELELTIQAARLALRSLVAAATADGCTIRYILAHRQADSWRRSDPGEWLWREVALACGVDELGLQTQPLLTRRHHRSPNRHGLAVPEVWGSTIGIPY